MPVNLVCLVHFCKLQLDISLLSRHDESVPARPETRGRHHFEVNDPRGEPHGIAGWSEAEVQRMLAHMKALIAPRLTAAVAAS